MAGAVKPGRQNWQWPWYSPEPAPRPPGWQPEQVLPAGLQLISTCTGSHSRLWPLSPRQAGVAGKNEASVG